MFTIIIYAIHKFFDFQDTPKDIFGSNLGIIGGIIVSLGLLLRSWAAGIINKNKLLTKTGPYQVCRHPLYLGSLLMAIGYLIILDDWFLWIVLILFMIPVYLPKILGEEQKLNELFPGEYDKFKQETGMIFPKKISLKKLIHKWSFKQWVKHTEYNAWIATIIATIALQFWYQYFNI
jgi:protein-S-isoprenylcysteine O-methyltransferase Ste14